MFRYLCLLLLISSCSPKWEMSGYCYTDEQQQQYISPQLGLKMQYFSGYIFGNWPANNNASNPFQKNVSAWAKKERAVFLFSARADSASAIQCCAFSSFPGSRSLHAFAANDSLRLSSCAKNIEVEPLTLNALAWFRVSGVSTQSSVNEGWYAETYFALFQNHILRFSFWCKPNHAQTLREEAQNMLATIESLENLETSVQ